MGFESSDFSSYALTYKDTRSSSPDREDNSTAVNNPVQQSTRLRTVIPSTRDRFSLPFWSGSLLISGFAAVWAWSRLKK